MSEKQARSPVLPGRLDTGYVSTGEEIAIVVLNWNGVYFLQRALESIVRFTNSNYQLVLIDNGSTDKSKDFIEDFVQDNKELNTTCLDFSENIYFSRAFNQGIKATLDSVRYVVVFCNDVEVKQINWLNELLSTMQETNAALVGNTHTAYVTDEQREIYQNNHPDYDDVVISQAMRKFLNKADASYTQVDGYCYMLDKNQLVESGLFLQGGDFYQYNSDWELYMRLNALGLSIEQHLPKVHHWHSLSELIALYPDRYVELIMALQDPQVLKRYLDVGRPLFSEESGFRSSQLS
ncbi:MAG: GT2 family glycosyltransferase [Parasphingorhabdus sp.]|jgi:GT2 family glycosyltransferase